MALADDLNVALSNAAAAVSALVNKVNELKAQVAAGAANVVDPAVVQQVQGLADQANAAVNAQ